jgi:hypothetical protein
MRVLLVHDKATPDEAVWAAMDKAEAALAVVAWRDYVRAASKSPHG